MTKFISEKILKKIKKGKIKMKPKSYFILKTALFVLGIIFASFATIFLASFIIFLLRASGILNFPAFGFKGIGLFLASLPWLLVLFVIVFVVILEFLARRFSVVYRRPLVYSILGIIVIILLLGVFVARTPMHSKLFFNAQEGKLPVVGPFYREGFIRPPDDIYFGRVFDIASDKFKIETKEGRIFSVIVLPETHLPFGGNIKEGDMVVVLGDSDGSIIRALGIREIIDEDTIRFHRHGPMPPPQFRR